MPILYNCKHDGDQYRITKFDADMNVESSYLCDTSACECPAGVRFTCRHREMLPKFINRGAVGTGWMFDYDRGGWVDMRQDDIGFNKDMQDALTDERLAVALQRLLDHGMPAGLDGKAEDGEKLQALTGEDHGPVFLSEPTPAEPAPTRIYRRL